MQGYLIFLTTFAVAGGLTWLARDWIFGTPPRDEDRGDAAGQEDFER